MQSSKIWIIVIVFLVIACLCMSAIIVAGGVALFIIRDDNAVTTVETRVIESDLPTPLNPSTESPPPLEDLSTPVPASDAAYETLQNLQAINVPNNDPRELAERLKGIQNIPETVPSPGNFKVGDQQTFWVSNVDTNENFQVKAVLRYVTDSAYFWIEDGARYDRDELAALANTFNDQIYPTDREFFGSEWTPGIDNDPHIYILYARGIGSSIAGYFSSADSVHPLAHPYSNAHEMFIFNADNTELGEEFTYGVLSHEFQHMIHWYRDRNEEGWLNEGFSELAAFLNGYDPGGFDYVFALNPDLQLNDWPNNSDATTPHYGASFLFLTYFLDRFGEDATKAMVAEPDNGLDSIDKILAATNARDASSGDVLTADDVFADWVITNYTNSPRLEDGRYVYQSYTRAPTFQDTEQVVDCQTGWESRTVSQYGTDYINLSCGQNFTLSFQGNSEVGVIPENANSGEYAFWSNKGDESDMTLTHTFDFSAIEAPINLEYATWYDIEKDYDYLYLSASADGQTWQILDTPSCTTVDPSGNSLGCGYTGTTNEYIQERVDLSQFAGQTVTLRFEYVTDAAVNGEGLLLDDIRIPQIGYSSDFEADAGGWDAQGFVRMQNRLPQTFKVSVLHVNGSPSVETFTIDAAQTISLPINAAAPSDSIVLIVSGTTRFTRQEAVYHFKLSQ